MIDAWWNAHALELVLAGAVWAVAGCVWLCETVHDIWRERRQKRKDGLL